MASGAELSALRARVVNILTTKHCQRIHFLYSNIPINRNGFSYVALAGVSEKAGFQVKVDAAQTSEASYNPRNNTFSFKRADYGANDSPFEMMTIVHESTHAVIDAQKTRVLMLSNEVCAYSAGALFNQFRAEEGLPSFDGMSQPVGGVYREAHLLAAKISPVMRSINYELYHIVSRIPEVMDLAAALRAGSHRYDHDDSYGEDGLAL